MSRLRGAVVTGVVAVSLVLVALNRGPAAPEPHDPSLAGVVATRDFVSPRTVHLVLVTGESIDLDLKTARNLNPNLDEPDPGELLLYGIESERPWFATAFPDVEIDGSFELRSQRRPVVGNSIVFESGLRLPLATKFSESLTGPMEAGAPVVYLLNGKGEVTRRE